MIQTDPQLSDYTAGFAERPELVELVDGSNVVTVFAPTNAATAQVANWDDIVADDAAFDSFVRSHLISGAVTAEQLFTGTEPYELTTLGGDTITVDPATRRSTGPRSSVPTRRERTASSTRSMGCSSCQT